jgi:predicted small lipoprotein YifL
MKQVFFLMSCVCLLSACGHVGNLTLPEHHHAEDRNVSSKDKKATAGDNLVKPSEGEK